MNDQLQQFATEYAKLRQAYIDAMPGSYSTEPLTHEQRMVVLSDSVPSKPDPSLWTAAEYAEKLAEYERLVGYKLSPLGNYNTASPRNTRTTNDDDPAWRDYLDRRRAENEALPGYGILRRMVEAQQSG